MKKTLAFLLAGGLLATAITSCHPDDPIPEVISEETYAGGELGTTFSGTSSRKWGSDVMPAQHHDLF